MRRLLMILILPLFLFACGEEVIDNSQKTVKKEKKEIRKEKRENQAPKKKKRVSKKTYQKKTVPLVKKGNNKIPKENVQFTQLNGNAIHQRFAVPNGYQRVKTSKGSFASYLRSLKLKPVGTKVKNYDGSIKSNPVHEAVVDLPIGHRDLHQCADAVMRLKAEYLWRKGAYNKIHFNFTNGFQVDYTKWMKGNRMVVSGNKTYWKKKAQPSNTYKDFWKYMELIFAYAGTSSLSKEMKSINMSDMQIGDVLIQGGFPGHAIIVLDMAVNSSGEKLYMLGQSYMPAQEFQVLKNFNTKSISPWYKLDGNDNIYTPEWNFTSSDLKRFND